MPLMTHACLEAKKSFFQDRVLTMISFVVFLLATCCYSALETVEDSHSASKSKTVNGQGLSKKKRSEIKFSAIFAIQ